VERTLFAWQLVRVSGPSMVPTLHHGDLVLVRLTGDARAGDVVLARFHSMPGRLVLKRVAAVEAGGAWLASDNSFAGGDSATHGLGEILGRVVLRRRGLRAQRVRRQRPSER
jgi:phage repressor protein C with HTH and peptisase S24 domain